MYKSFYFQLVNIARMGFFVKNAIILSEKPIYTNKFVYLCIWKFSNCCLKESKNKSPQNEDTKQIRTVVAGNTDARLV